MKGRNLAIPPQGAVPDWAWNTKKWLRTTPIQI